MSSPIRSPLVREYPAPERAPGRVTARRRKPLRSHWLTGALICGLTGLSLLALRHYYHVEQQLRDVRARRAEIQAQLEAAEQRNAHLRQRLQQVTSDSYMELKARDLGFIYPNERVYQKAANR